MLYSVPDAAAQLGISDRLMRDLIYSGAIATVKIHTRTLVPHTELEGYVNQLQGLNAPTPLHRAS